MIRVKAFVDKIESHPRLGWAVQFIKFGIVGVSNTFISLMVYYAGLHVLGLGYQISYVLGFFISAVNAYYWNNKYVFKSKASKSIIDHIQAYFKLVMAYSFTFFLGFFLIWLWIEKLGINQSVAPLLNILITTPINFLMNKYWAFGEGKNK